MRSALHLLCLAGTAISLVALGYVVNDLASGLAELPKHWWSSGAVAAVILTGAAAVLTRPRPEREAARTD